MGEPINIEEARAQIRMDGDTSRDADLARYIRDAREWVENYTGQTLIAGDVEETFRTPGRTVALRAWPIAAGAIATVTYVDSDGVEQLVDAHFNASRRPALVYPVGAWPLNRSDQQLRVTVRAGYETADAIPGNMRRAMLLLIAAYDADREGGDLFEKTEIRAKSLCRSFRRTRI